MSVYKIAKLVPVSERTIDRLLHPAKREEEKIIERARYKANRPYHLERFKRYGKANRSKINARNKEKYKLEPNYNIECRIRARQYAAFKGIGKTETTKELLGCSIACARMHLEKQFKKGMSWHNYGEWEIDHIRPLASFDLTKKEDRQAACHYTNLQPLWARDNKSKGARLS